MRDRLGYFCQERRLICDCLQSASIRGGCVYLNNNPVERIFQFIAPKLDLFFPPIGVVHFDVVALAFNFRGAAARCAALAT